MTCTTQATIEANKDIPAITLTREFDAPVELLFRAHTDGDLVARWMGPPEQKMVVEEYDASTGGSWRYWSSGEDGVEHHFYGSFHEVRPNERIVQTFTYAGFPDGVALEQGRFEDLGDGRSRLTWVSLCDSFEGRDMMLASGMEVGVHEGYEKLDALLAELG
ncbi:MAG: SRPBCC family protein [Nocardioidaceae bacterium]|nr:SRPBCC family protein [Nocardioidaceae bacterium]NUS51452.1 SRPBCC family protein [Nocardioidaceae bacterium]